MASEATWNWLFLAQLKCSSRVFWEGISSVLWHSVWCVWDRSKVSMFTHINVALSEFGAQHMQSMVVSAVPVLTALYSLRFWLCSKLWGHGRGLPLAWLNQIFGWSDFERSWFCGSLGKILSCVHILLCVWFFWKPWDTPNSRYFSNCYQFYAYMAGTKLAGHSRRQPITCREFGVFLCYSCIHRIGEILVMVLVPIAVVSIALTRFWRWFRAEPRRTI